MSDYTLRDYVELDAQEVLNGAINVYEQKHEELTGKPITLYLADERRILLSAVMYMFEVIAGQINYRANQNLVADCDEMTLLAKGEERNVPRKKAKCAVLTERFHVAAARNSDILIPAGKRVTADGRKFFVVKEDTVLPAGSTYVDVLCEAVEPGELYNDLAIGQVNILADNIPYITSVSNIKESMGGLDLENIEDYRIKVLNAALSYNTAGAYTAYVYQAMAADDSIVDAEATEDGTTVYIYLLCTNGALPTTELIKKVTESLSQNTVRPLTDNVIVKAPDEVNYKMDVSYKISARDEYRATTIKEAVQQAVDNYILYLKNGLGREINPEELKRDMYNAGASSVTVTQPAYVSVSRQQVAKCNETPIVTYNGIV